MSNAPLQNISIDHPRFVDVLVYVTAVDPVTGVVTTSIDSTSALVVSVNQPSACVPTVDPANPRRVILTAGILPVGGPDVGWSVTVTCPQSNPNANPAPSTIPGRTSGILNTGHIDFVTAGDA